MSFNVEQLLCLLDHGNVSKDELVSAMNQIQFCSISSEHNEALLTNDKLFTKTNTFLQFDSMTEKDTSKDMEFYKPKLNIPINKYEETDSKENKENVMNKNTTNFTRSLTNKNINRNLISTGTKSPPKNESLEFKEEFCIHKSEKGPSFIQRLEAYKQQKDFKLKEKKAKLHEIEGKECIFIPKTNIKKIPKQSSTKDINQYLCKYTKKEKHLEEMRSKESQRREDEFGRICTFHPSICSKEAKPRYKSSIGTRSHKKCFDFSKEKFRHKEVECTFRPEINKRQISSDKVRQYLSDDPYKRLSQLEKNNRLMEGAKENSEGNLLLKTYKDSSIKRKLSDFYKRQMEFKYKKEKHICEVRNELECKRTPRIDKNSKKIAKTLVTFNERSKTLLHKNESCILKLNEEAALEYKFKPNILPQSKRMHPKNIEEMVYGEIVKRQKSIEKLRNSIENEEKHQCPFKPVIINNKHINSRSKLQLKDNLKTFVKRMNMENIKKQNIKEIEKEILEFKETKECTYEPKINKYPSYIKKKVTIKGANKDRMQQTYSKKIESCKELIG